ncbi:pyridoxal phosphate-dependent transferase [Melampsora americana]|nr:pyridoxal phosphate-dependent transferase [Melampsora americana]
MHLNIPKQFPTNWTELGAKAKGLLTPSHDHKKLNVHSKGHEDECEAHQVFRSVLGHSKLSSGSQKRKSNATLKPIESQTDQLASENNVTAKKEEAVSEVESHEEVDEDEGLPGISSPGSTGVIFVMDRAMANGFSYEDPDWANFGQGAPEVGDIPGASHKPDSFDIASMGIDVHECKYAPTTGVKALRAAVANYYNQTYRIGKESQYTFENVCIVPGGRAGLTRVASVVGEVYVGYQLPEYTAYDQMLSVFRRLVPIPSALSAEDNYKLHIDTLRENINQMGLSVIFASNPRNPTGQAIEGEELKELVEVGRNGQTVVLDEFYSWYNLDGTLGESLSGAKYVENVNKDALVIIDGLTKNWRCPGWRVCWVVGPKCLISALSQSGSFLDGGASHIMQMAAIPMLDLKRVQQDKLALQKHFRMKKERVLARLEEMGMKVKVPPKWTFYIWLDLSDLPPPLNSGLVFFEELLKQKVIVVPGIFFDLNPAHRRNLFSSPCHHFVRLSFGPPLPQLEKGLDGIERVLRKAHEHLTTNGHLGNMGKNLAPHVGPTSKQLS